MKKPPPIKAMLYCGMANDIATPLALPYNFDVLYVIDDFDGAFSSDNTWEGQQREIQYVLEQGSNTQAPMRLELERFFHNRPTVLREIQKEYSLTFPPGRIISQTEVSSQEGGRWEVVFKQNGRTRRLVMFHHRNFLRAWPDEVKNLEQIASFGATFPLENNLTLQHMLTTRCKSDCLFLWNHGEPNIDLSPLQSDPPLKLGKRTIYANTVSNILKFIQQKALLANSHSYSKYPK